MAFADAVRKGNVAAVRLLLSDGRADPAQSSFSPPPLVYASLLPDLEIFTLLLVDGRADSREHASDVLQTACSSGRADVVRLLLEDGRIDPADMGDKSIVQASELGHTEIVRLLLTDDRVDPTKWDFLTVILALKHSHEDVLRLLVSDRRVDPGAGTEKSLLVWCDDNLEDAVTVLLDHHYLEVDPDELRSRPVGYVSCIPYATIQQRMMKLANRETETRDKRQEWKTRALV
ncbi:hypothetical protein HKX48_009566 [Thoreauomyces humboldtii]|nr:hypothetical protein HKX48_009566 [Thoreauomyces humboldtii]